MTDLPKFATGGKITGPGTLRGDEIGAYLSEGFYYRHNLPGGEKDHLINADGTRIGKCCICGEQVFDPDRVRAALDKINQQEDQ